MTLTSWDWFLYITNLPGFSGFSIKVLAFSNFIKVVNLSNIGHGESLGKWCIIKTTNLWGFYLIKCVNVKYVYVIRDKLKTFHTYMPRTLEAYAHPRILIYSLNKVGLHIISLWMAQWRCHNPCTFQVYSLSGWTPHLGLWEVTSDSACQNDQSRVMNLLQIVNRICYKMVSKVCYIS